jgi:hypothetical protein
LLHNSGPWVPDRASLVRDDGERVTPTTISDLIFKQPLALSSSPGLTGRPSIPGTAATEPKGRGVLDAPLEAGHDGGGRRDDMFSRRVASESFQSSTLENKEGTGKTGCPPHPWSACNKKARGRTTGTSGSSGLPCAMVLRLIRDLPGDRALLPPSFVDHPTNLAPASGRQDHATSPSACNVIRLMTRGVHRIPLPTFVTIAKRPS